MPTPKVSVAFLDKSVSVIANKSLHIAKFMTKNDLFKLSPISPEGLQAAADHLKDMEKKAHSKRKHDIENRDSALGDVDDFIRQISAYMNRGSFNKEELLTSGFDIDETVYTKPKAAVAEATE